MTDRIPVDPPERIELENDTLVLDEIFHREVLGGASRRTGKRYEKCGLPFVTLRGYKYRPLRAGREWLERQIQHPNTALKRRVRAS